MNGICKLFAIGMSFSCFIFLMIASSTSARADLPLVKFGTRVDAANIDLSPAADPVLVWNSADKQWLQKEVNGLIARYPGLFARCEKLKIFRVHKINVPEPHKSRRESVTVAATAPGAIFIADEYFRLEERERRFSLVHEIVHACDIGNLIAYSPEFVEFAAIYRKSILPKTKTREPLPEELADSFAFYERGGLTPKDRKLFDERILPQLIANDNGLKQFNILSGKALTAQKIHRYKDAIVSWNGASKLYRRSPFPHTSLGYCYIKETQMDKALEETNIAEDCYKAAGVPESESNRLTHAYQRALLLIQCKQDLDGALTMLNQVAAYRPTPEVLKLRDAVKDKLMKRTSKQPKAEG
ncbi:MAG: hypothetical protein SGJ27_25175 [Candidatus Melainabacteria bacterium]|nr:hypothetical protein [Candidatus Melainabacteria bacterium]